ncbi:hypothetical protein N7453_007976 [Penicillium expansum]|nr:hypothetical protein N7453_007976 [Penicillium expansum]
MASCLNEEASGAAENAMKRWILTGGWRDASYLYEPARCQPSSPIGQPTIQPLRKRGDSIPSLAHWNQV